MVKIETAIDVHIAAEANVSAANVKRARASGRSHNVHVIRKDGED
jgi:hypothetical protein